MDRWLSSEDGIRMQTNVSVSDVEQPAQGTATNPRRSILALTGLSLPFAGAVAILLWSAYLGIENRFSLGYDVASRTTRNLQAADAMMRLELPRLLKILCFQPTWPTLRMLLAAPLQAIVGPSLALESALTVAYYAALLPVLALGVALFVRPASRAALGFAVAALVLCANRALLAYAASGMLEVFAALLTLAAAIAWIALREPGSKGRVWLLALLGNCVFHVKHQYGIFFGLTVLAAELAMIPTGERRKAFVGLGRAILATLRRATFCAWLVPTLFSGAVALAVVRKGGLVWNIGPFLLSMRRPHGVIFWVTFALFWGVQFELWRSRRLLTEALPERIRSLWVWLLCPMGAWILLPGSGRLRLLFATAFEYKSTASDVSWMGRLAYYPEAMATEWYTPLAAIAVGFALVSGLWSGRREPLTRQRLGLLAALALGELTLLVMSTRTNYQTRFVLNLAPLLALAAGLAVAALPRLARWSMGLALAGALAISMLAVWQRPMLISLLRTSFAEAEVGQDCRALAAELSFPDALVVNALPISHLRDCDLAFTASAMKRRASLELVERPLGSDEERPVIYLTQGCDAGLPASTPARLRPVGPATQRGSLCARVLRVAETDPRFLGGPR
jgi:hypothetical protein